MGNSSSCFGERKKNHININEFGGTVLELGGWKELLHVLFAVIPDMGKKKAQKQNSQKIQGQSHENSVSAVLSSVVFRSHIFRSLEVRVLDQSWPKIDSELALLEGVSLDKRKAEMGETWPENGNCPFFGPFCPFFGHFSRIFPVHHGAKIHFSAFFPFRAGGNGVCTRQSGSQL